MPRKAPSSVIENRITLGNFERDEFKQTMDALQRQLKVDAALKAGQTVMNVGAIIGVGYLGFLSVGILAKSLGYAGDLVDKVKDGASQAVFGKQSIVSNRTGQTIKNPVHDIPIIGGLFGLGMDIGNAGFDGEPGFFSPLNVFGNDD